MALTDKQNDGLKESRRFRLNRWTEKVRFGLGFGVLVSFVVFGVLLAVGVSREAANSWGIVALFTTMFASLVIYHPNLENDQKEINH
jgi:hypothetical protein